MTTTQRVPLTHDRIIDAAVAFADREGIEAMSMRRLGAELDVEAMALYNHVTNKDDILDGMIDYVFNSIPVPASDSQWQDAVRLIGVAGMDAFTRHPWVVSLLTVRNSFGPGVLKFTDSMLGIFLSAGFSDENAHHAWQMLASHTCGYAFQSAANPGDHHDKGVDFEDLLAQSSDLYPNVARLAPLLVGCAYDSEYAYGLEIIIDGLESRLATDN